MKKIIAMIAVTSIAAISLSAGVPASCFGCHGKDGSKNTMVPSSKPNTMKKADIVKALNGYKAGTLNKYKKGALMKNFAKSLTTAQIKSIANSWGK
jgi:cytochrome c553